MKPETYLDLKSKLIDLGYAEEIDWQEEVEPPGTSLDLASETVFVICNSGMKYEIAVSIYNKVMKALIKSFPVFAELRHDLKARAIKAAWIERDKRFEIYKSLKTDQEKLDWFESLDGIGKVTKYHLAKNCGLDVYKPDRHIVRIAGIFNITPDEMFRKLSNITGDKIAVIDIVLWRAGNLGLI